MVPDSRTIIVTVVLLDCNSTEELAGSRSIVRN